MMKNFAFRKLAFKNNVVIYYLDRMRKQHNFHSGFITVGFAPTPSRKPYGALINNPGAFMASLGFFGRACTVVFFK